MAFWKEQLPKSEIIPISALENFNTEAVMDKILELLPEGPAYYPKDALTDRPERFFVSEIIREKILIRYKDNKLIRIILLVLKKILIRKIMNKRNML